MDENDALRPGHLDLDTWNLIQAAVPIPVVDIVAIQRQRDTITRIGLVRREAANELGYAWGHIGGRMLIGEDIADTIERVAVDATGVSVRDALDEWQQPDYVLEYRQDAIDNAAWSGRRHAISLVYAIEFPAETTSAVRGQRFEWFDPEELPALPLWPGTLEAAVQVLG